MNIFFALVPGLALLVVAFVLDIQQHRDRREEVQKIEAMHAADALDLRLGKLIDLTAFCATSPSLVQRLDLAAFVEECGRYAKIIEAWVVLVELGETHRQIVNSRVQPGGALPEYPRAEEQQSILSIEARSRTSGRPEIADLFEGQVAQTGVVTAGQYVQLEDGRDTMLFVGTEVGVLSALLANLAGERENVFALVDPSRRIVARSRDIDRLLFSDAPSWMAETLAAGAPGGVLDRPGPTTIGGFWDVGYHPLEIAPDWMAVAVSPRPDRPIPLDLSGIPFLIAALGLALSGLSLWWLSYRQQTARRVAEAELSNQEKSRLLASLAHDIRTPIVSLLATLELDERENGSGTSSASAHRAAETLLALVDDILELSFLGSDQFTMTPSQTDLKQLAEDVIDSLCDSAAKKGLDLQLKMSRTLLPVVEVDRLRLEQVLTNLLTNAIKYTDTGSVTLHLDAEEYRNGRLAVTFKVADTGLGIAPCDVERIFREFGRLDRAAVSDKAGTGLGLAICQRILRGMGSRLMLESELDAGSTFSFRLQLPAVPNWQMSRSTGKTLTGLTILLAEDEPVIRRVTAHRLAEAGAEVVEASDGAEALATLETLAPDLLLLDLQMPELDGVDVIRKLRSGDASCSLPIFVLTSHISGQKAAEARTAGADATFTKPIQVSALAAAFRAMRGGSGHNTPTARNGDRESPAPLIDLTNFRDVTDHLDAPGKSALLTQFENSLRSDLSELRVLIGDEDFSQVGRRAHRASGLCKVMGASAIDLIFMSIERHADDNDASAVGSLVAEADEVLSLTLDQMKKSLCDETSRNPGGMT